MTSELMLRYAVALAVGLLVGLERGWRDREEPAGHRIAGIRTYSITGLLGAALGSLTQKAGSSVPLVGCLLVYGALFGTLQLRKAADEKEFSITGVVAGLLVLVLGALSVLGDYRIAGATGVALAGLLASRELLHSLLKKVTWVEIRSAIVLAAMSAIILPLLPDRVLDPWGGFNPKEIWKFTVLTAALSYMGYIAVRMAGPSKGLLVTGLTGGVVSSTSVTVAFARTASQAKGAWPLVAGACMAAMMSIIRVCAVIYMIRPGVLLPVSLPAAAAAAAFGLGALLFVLLPERGDRAGDGGLVPPNPFDFGHLMLFAAGFAAVSTVSAIVVRNFGTASLVASSTFSGMFDVDIAVLSALRLDATFAGPDQVAEGILAALGANALGRVSLAVATGPARYWLPLAGVTAFAVFSGFTVLFFVPKLQ